jgi:hypothetical protein
MPRTGNNDGTYRDGRRARSWAVCLLSVGEESLYEPVPLMEGPEQRCREYYQEQRLNRPSEAGMALVLMDGFKRPVYACS